MAYTLPKVDPSNPALPAPIFGDVSAARGDHLRANNSFIWDNLDALAALFESDGTANIANRQKLTIYPSGDFQTIVDNLASTVGAGEYRLGFAYGVTNLPIEFVVGILVCDVTITDVNAYVVLARRRGTYLSWLGYRTPGWSINWTQILDANCNPPAAAYDIIIDSDAKLAKWAASDTYARVLIKAGTWTLASGGIDLTARGTKEIIGEAGSSLVFSSSAYGLKYTSKPTTKDYRMSGVSVSCTNAGGASSSFLNCVNLYACTATCSATGGAAKGFDTCENLINCSASSSGNNSSIGFYSCSMLDNCTGTGNSSAVEGDGFKSCSNLINCKGTGTTNSNINFGEGFSSCVQVVNCQGVGTNSGSSNGYGFYGCTKCVCNKALSASKTATYSSSYADAGTSYACADTPNGGWNS